MSLPLVYGYEDLDTGAVRLVSAADVIREGGPAFYFQSRAASDWEGKPRWWVVKWSCSGDVCALGEIGGTK